MNRFTITTSESRKRWRPICVFFKIISKNYTKAHFIAFHLIFTFRVQSNKISMNQRNIIQNKITWNIKKFYSNRLVIWRSQVQALAGPHFYYSDLRVFVGSCFSFLRKPCRNKRFESEALFRFCSDEWGSKV